MRVLRTIGRYVYYAVMVVILASAVMGGVTQIGDAQQPVYWGTFEQNPADPDANQQRYPRNEARGTWRSDDGDLTVSDVRLLGTADRSGFTRASYQPHSVFSDVESDTVRGEFETAFRPWAPVMLAFIGLGMALFQMIKWQRLRAEKRPKATWS